MSQTQTQRFNFHYYWNQRDVLRKSFGVLGTKVLWKVSSGGPPIMNHVPLEKHCKPQSIGSTVSDVIVRSSLWSTATRSSPLDYFSKLLQVVDN